jgi:hypothetical protein
MLRKENRDGVEGRSTAMRIVTLRVWHGDRKPAMDKSQTFAPHVCVHASTGYKRVEGNRWASRNGP